MITIAPQLKFDLRIPTRRPLLPMKAAMWFLDRDEDDVLQLIAGGKIGFAFDLSRAASARAFVCIWRGSAVKYRLDEGGGIKPEVSHFKDHYPGAATGLADVLKDVLPDRDTLRGTEVRNIFSCNQGHIANLLADSAMRMDGRRSAPVKGRRSSPWILRSSVAEFLTARRIV